MNRRWLILLFFPFLAARAGAGELLSLRQAMDRAEKFGYDAAVAHAETDAAQADAHRSLSVFLPQIRIASTYTATNDPLNVFGMKLKEQRVTAADFNPDILNHPDRFTQYTTRIELQQPLVNLDGFWGRAAAMDGARATEQKELRTKRYTSFRVKMAYYELVLARKSLGVLDTAYSAARSNAELAARSMEEGLINRSDYLFSRVRLLDVESKQADAANAVRNAESALRLLLGAADSTELIPTDTLSIPGAVPGAPNIDEINSTRSDMRAMQFAVDASEEALAMNRLKLLPTLNAFGSYGWNDQKMFGRQGPGWTIGAIAQWDIFPGFNHIAEIQKAGANLDRARTELERQRAQNRNDLESAFRTLESSRKRLGLSEETVFQAAENYRILSERFASGIGNTTDVLNAEASLAGARLQRLQTLFSYNATLFTIELLTEHGLSQPADQQ